MEHFRKLMLSTCASHDHASHCLCLAQATDCKSKLIITQTHFLHFTTQVGLVSKKLDRESRTAFASSCKAARKVRVYAYGSLTVLASLLSCVLCDFPGNVSWPAAGARQSIQCLKFVARLGGIISECQAHS